VEAILYTLAQDLRQRGGLDVKGCFIDGMFVVAAGCCAPEQPERLIGDRAYDSDPLDERLAEQGIEMIAPHGCNRRKPGTQDGRKLRPYLRRWKVEWLLAWLGNFRRLPVRYERYLANYLGFVQLACIAISLRGRS